MDSIGCKSFGIFWDIENCPIPSFERAANIVHSIKQFIATKYESKESVGQQPEPCEFCCSCDTRNLDQRHVEGLNRCGVDILHVNPIRTNGNVFKVNADSKLIECIQKFVDHHFNKSLIFVLTGDIDFAPIIRTAKRRGFEVILLFGANTSQDLKNCATEAHSFYDIITNRDSEVMESDDNGSASNTSTTNRPMTTASTHFASTYYDVRQRMAPPVAVGHRLPMNSQPVPQFLSNTIRTMNRIERQDSNESQTSTQNPNRNQINQNSDKLDENTIKLIEDITKCDRHVVIKVLRICGGNPDLAINAILSD